MSRPILAALFVVATVATAATATAQPALTAPAAAPPAERPASSGGEPASPERWLAVGALSLDGAQVDGARLQVDLFGGGLIAAGLAGSVLARGDQVMDTEVPAFAGLGYLAATVRLTGPLSLRGQLGLGGELSAHATDQATAMSADALSTTLITEGALTLGLDVGRHWGLTAGPIVQSAESPAVGVDATTVTWFAGLRHR
ncbi:MAG: hypothetical protein JNK64_23535 [Myxococcales bacterium]|nr:hypothetical protein [Myxococcales bacterium]